MLQSNVGSKWTASSNYHFPSINTSFNPLDHMEKAKRACNKQTPISALLRIIAPSYRCNVHTNVHGGRDELRLAASDRHSEGLARKDFTQLACGDPRGSDDSASHSLRPRYRPENAILQTSWMVHHAVVQTPSNNIAYDCA